MIYEQIPDIMVSAIHSIYRARYVDVPMISPARFLDAVNSSAALETIKLVGAQIAAAASLLLIGFIIFVRVQKSALKSTVPSTTPAASTSSPQQLPTGALRERWNTLVAHLDSPQEAQWKVAVMEADKLIDDALAKAGFPGATFGDRLSNMKPGTLRSLDGVWWAHKIRNRLAHEMDYFLRYTEARQAIGYYEAALAELQLI